MDHRLKLRGRGAAILLTLAAIQFVCVQAVIYNLCSGADSQPAQSAQRSFEGPSESGAGTFFAAIYRVVRMSLVR